MDSFVISWWRDVGTADDSRHYIERFGNLAEAEELVSYLELDPAVRTIQCSWLPPEPIHIVEEIPF